VRECSIAPGLFKTPLPATLPESVQQSLPASIPFPKRLGRPAASAALRMAPRQPRTPHPHRPTGDKR
jgi:hypothetical protein